MALSAIRAPGCLKIRRTPMSIQQIFRCIVLAAALASAGAFSQRALAQGTE